MFILVYECPDCNEVWSQRWECTVDDTCPNCGKKNIQPVEVIDSDTTKD